MRECCFPPLFLMGPSTVFQGRGRRVVVADALGFAKLVVGTGPKFRPDDWTGIFLDGGLSSVDFACSPKWGEDILMCRV